MKEIFNSLALLLIGTSLYVLLNTGAIFYLRDKNNKKISCEDKKFDKNNIVVCGVMLVGAVIVYIIGFLFF